MTTVICGKSDCNALLQIEEATAVVRANIWSVRVSAAGVLFYLDANLSVGSPIEFSLALPPEMFGLDRPVQVNCFGRVARAFNA